MTSNTIGRGLFMRGHTMKELNTEWVTITIDGRKVEVNWMTKEEAAALDGPQADERARAYIAGGCPGQGTIC